MVLYHGSGSIVQCPDIKYSKKNNDYGAGFYCTEHVEAAREWACGSVAVRNAHKAICNRYEIETDGLKIVHLGFGYNILNWMAVLIQNRVFDLGSELMEISYDWIGHNFHVDISAADIVLGYSADDSYFAFARDFLSNTISLERLSCTLRLDDLGQQVVIKSQRAYDRLKFIGYEEVDFDKYQKLFELRDQAARERCREAGSSQRLDETYIIDLMRRWNPNR